MVCTECGREVRRVCRDCQRARARAGMLLHQRRFLQTWQAGKLDLLLRRHGGTLHIQLFDDRWHAYCGAEMFTFEPPERHAILPPDVCPACRTIFNQLAEKASMEVRQ